MPEPTTAAADKSRLLIVDDEAPLLRLMQTYLGRLGYSVTGAGDLAGALDVLREDHSIELVIADLSLMGTGDASLSQIAGVRRDLRVLICSGRPFEISGLPPDLQPRFGFLQKPFVPKMLAEAVTELLERDIGQRRARS